MKAKEITRHAIDPEVEKNLKVPYPIRQQRVCERYGGAKEGIATFPRCTTRIGHPEDMVKLGDIVHKSRYGQRQAGAYHEGVEGNPEPDPSAPKHERPLR